jgi:hypothetical protein
MKATRSQILKRIAELGCTLDEDDPQTFYIDAPKGLIFSSNLCHALGGYQHHNVVGQSWKPEAYAEALHDMEMGVEPCTDPGCDVCHDLCDCNDRNCPLRHPNRTPLKD